MNVTETGKPELTAVFFITILIIKSNIVNAFFFRARNVLPLLVFSSRALGQQLFFFSFR